MFAQLSIICEIKNFGYSTWIFNESLQEAGEFGDI